MLIVGIGASAGGIEAIQSFFEGLPETLEGVAFVIVMHLDPERDSSLAEVLQHRTSMKVRQLTEREKVEARTVYVIPPNKSLSVDTSLPDMNGIELVRRLLDRRPDILCLMYSGHEETFYVERALEAGARGYLVKGNPRELPGAIRQVLNGGTYLSRAVCDGK